MIKRWLQRWPSLFGLLKRGYYGGLYLTERYVLGTRLHELLWRARRFEDSARRSIGHPHRTLLAERIRRYAPVASVLEIGCNAGPNLVVLHRAFPEARLFGLDVSARAVAAAGVLLAEEGAANVTAAVGVADDLSSFADRSMDVVFSDATLMYVGPDKIGRVVAEMARVARKAVMFNEWHLFDDAPGAGGGAVSHWYFAHWVHDYRAILAEVPGVRTVTIARLPPGLWGAGGWEIYGAVIEAEL